VRQSADGTLSGESADTIQTSKLDQGRFQTGSQFCQAGTDRAAAASSSNAVEMSLMLMTPIKL